jgi:hypothetical protein
MAILSTLGLIATSNNSKVISYATSISGPETNLTNSEPRARFLVHVHVNALGPDNSDSTQNAFAGLTGKITPSEAFDGGSPSVDVGLTDHDNRRIDVPIVSAISEFQMSRQLSFTGKCWPPNDASAPCETQFDVVVGRSDWGAKGGALLVDWQLDFNASAGKQHGPDEGPVAPPWTIEVTLQ